MRELEVRITGECVVGTSMNTIGETDTWVHHYVKLIRETEEDTGVKTQTGKMTVGIIGMIEDIQESIGARISEKLVKKEGIAKRFYLME